MHGKPPTTQTPLLSVVTGTWDRRESLRRLIRSIADHTPDTIHWELVISDCSAQPFVDADFLAYRGRVRVIDDRPKTTCIAGYRKAFDACRGEWVIWLNDDVEVTAGWATEAIRFMTAHPEIGLGALYYSEGPPPSPWRVNSYRDTLYANFGILRRELGAELGWMNCGAMRMYGNDNVLTWKVLLAGLGVVGIPGARVIHHAVSDRQKVENQAMRGTDPEILMARFERCLPLIQATYRKHAHLQGQTVIGSADYVAQAVGR